MSMQEPREQPKNLDAQPQSTVAKSDGQVEAGSAETSKAVSNALENDAKKFPVADAGETFWEHGKVPAKQYPPLTPEQIAQEVAEENRYFHTPFESGGCGYGRDFTLNETENGFWAHTAYIRKPGPNETKLNIPDDGLKPGDPCHTFYWNKSGRIVKSIWYGNGGRVGNRSLTRTYRYNKDGFLTRQTEKNVFLNRKKKTRKSEMRFKYIPGRPVSEYTEIAIDENGKKTETTYERREKKSQAKK